MKLTKQTKIRDLMQFIGTDLFREQLHTQIWINSLFNKYKEGDNWCITDVRFINEAEAIKKRDGILIRINRDLVVGGDDYGFVKVSAKQAEKDGIITPPHNSETALDNYNKFDYVIDNNGTIEELIDKVKEILIKEGIIK